MVFLLKILNLIIFSFKPKIKVIIWIEIRSAVFSVISQPIQDSAPKGRGYNGTDETDVQSRDKFDA